MSPKKETHPKIVALALVLDQPVTGSLVVDNSPTAIAELGQEILTEIQALTIRSTADEATATDWLAGIRNAMTKARAYLVGLNKPHQEKIATNTELLRNATAPIKAAEEILAGKISVHIKARLDEQRRLEQEALLEREAQERLAREAAEKARAAETARLEAEAKLRAAQEAARQAPPPPQEATLEEYFNRIDAGEPVAVVADSLMLKAQQEVEQAREDHALAVEDLAHQHQEVQALVAPAAPAAPKSIRSASGAVVTLAEKWDWEVEDLALVPERYTTRVLNPQAIRAALKSGVRSIPGLRLLDVGRVSARGAR